MQKIVYLVVLLLSFSQIANAKEIELIPDTVLWRPSKLPGYTLVLQECSICHSAGYAEYQPPNTTKAFWTAQVLRMKNVFNAPVQDKDVPIIVEYLNQTYGANRK